MNVYKSRLIRGYERARRRGEGIEPGAKPEFDRPDKPKSSGIIGGIKKALDPERASKKKIEELKPKIAESKRINAARQYERKRYGGVAGRLK